MPEKIVYLNGSLVSGSDAKVSVLTGNEGHSGVAG